MENLDNLYMKINFDNTEIAFSHKSDKALKKAGWLFRMMNKPWLVGLGSKMGLMALRWGLPVEGIVKKTIFEQFCGGTTLLETKETIEHLAKYDVAAILDYGAEAKQSEEDFNTTMRYTIRAIEFAAHTQSVPVVSLKITGLGRFGLIQKLQSGYSVSEKEQKEFDHVLKRLDSICHVAREKGVGVFIDAEESWIQETIDYLATIMMHRYNKEHVTIYNTFQMYRHDRLEYLKNSFAKAIKEDYLLGAKLVRGAYMEKERARAAKYKYPDPIQPNKEATDRDYNAALAFCIENHHNIGLCNATHNQRSCEYQVELMQEHKIPFNHPHLNVCQLYGMSDHLSFNLAKNGFNVAKYVPYGPVKDVIPYLIRRAQENTSVTGDMSRELSYIKSEIKRRGL